MDSVKDVAQIIYYLTLSIAGPLAPIDIRAVITQEGLRCWC
jgi:hypothetical protein